MKLWMSNRLEVLNDTEDYLGSEASLHNGWRHQAGKIREKKVKIARYHK